MTNHIIDWRFVHPADGWEIEPDAVVWIDVVALDAAWRTTDQYIEPGGANGQDNRYAKVGAWFDRNRHCNMGFASFDGNAFGFTDGRHRFSWLRDHGVSVLPLQVPLDQAERFEREFGTTVHLSILPKRSMDKN
ncbi:hypothetical protein [Sphingobium sp. B12D2B]|uniref:hypothetical protein n=1 Tax=Sphingobium sp. B12D2B TaxID=2940577 RepID=UPI0022240612|nr:hypothetical protein [Sphingobium sp. B12D2B]MCW2349167.1 hypothetical protein [Sphingobium sp. B12D2B]